MAVPDLATAAAVAVLTDAVRLAVYGLALPEGLSATLLGAPLAGALVGSAAGRFLLPRMAPEKLEGLVELFLWAAALGLMAGLSGGASPPARASG